MIINEVGYVQMAWVINTVSLLKGNYLRIIKNKHKGTVNSDNLVVYLQSHRLHVMRALQ